MCGRRSSTRSVSSMVARAAPGSANVRWARVSSSATWIVSHGSPWSSSGRRRCAPRERRAGVLGPPLMECDACGCHVYDRARRVSSTASGAARDRPRTKSIDNGTRSPPRRGRAGKRCGCGSRNGDASAAQDDALRPWSGDHERSRSRVHGGRQRRLGMSAATAAWRRRRASGLRDKRRGQWRCGNDGRPTCRADTGWHPCGREAGARGCEASR